MSRPAIALALPKDIIESSDWLKLHDAVEVEEWGAARYTARVTAIELVDPGEKYGLPVPAAPWALVRACGVTVSLDRGTWAYGDRLSPASMAEASTT